MLRISAYAVTDPGLVRTTNEDSVLVTERLVAVADGLGGQPAGEVASRLAVDRMAVLAEQPAIAPDDVRAALADVNRVIRADADAHPERRGMCTTLCGVGLVTVDGAQQCVVFNVGDSRVYRGSGAGLAQVSVDHSEVAELRAAGLVTAQAAAVHPWRNVVTRCLGSDPAPTPDLWVFAPDERERFLVCSDGLTDELDDEAIATILGAHAEPEPAATALLAEALAAGGRDNIAVIVADIGGASEPPRA